MFSLSKSVINMCNSGWKGSPTTKWYGCCMLLQTWANLGDLGIFRKLRWLSVIYYIQNSVGNCGSNVFDMFLLSRTQKTFAGDGKTSWTWTYWSKYNRIYPDPPHLKSCVRSLLFRTPCRSQKHVRGWRSLGSTCWKRREKHSSCS